MQTQLNLNVSKQRVKVINMDDKEILKCKHQWETESEGEDSVTYCLKCGSTKRELRKISESLKNKRLGEYS